MKKVQIPFCGFYETIISNELDDHIDYMINGFNEKFGTELSIDDIDIEIDYNNIAKEYSEFFMYKFESRLNEKYKDIELKWKFDSLFHPKFYNYYTDEIYIKLSKKSIDELLDTFDELSVFEDLSLYEILKIFAEKFDLYEFSKTVQNNVHITFPDIEYYIECSEAEYPYQKYIQLNATNKREALKSVIFYQRMHDNFIQDTPVEKITYLDHVYLNKYKVNLL